LCQEIINKLELEASVGSKQVQIVASLPVFMLGDNSGTVDTIQNLTKKKLKIKNSIELMAYLPSSSS
jgi:hypothetical protein